MALRAFHHHFGVKIQEFGLNIIILALNCRSLQESLALSGLSQGFGAFSQGFDEVGQGFTSWGRGFRPKMEQLEWLALIITLGQPFTIWATFRR